MKNVSNEFKKIEKSGGPFYAYAKCTLMDGTELLFDSETDFYASGNSFSESGGYGFPLGAAVSKQITITLDNHDERYSSYDFFGAKIVLYTEADLSDGTQERILEGTFTVIDSVAPGDALKINATDNMYKLDSDFESSLTYPVALQQIWNEICDYYDLVNGSPTFLNDNYVVQSKPETETGREMAGYIAQIAVGNAYIDANGKLCIKSYDFTPFESNPLVSGGKFGQNVADTISSGNFGDGLAEILSGGVFGESLSYYTLSDFATSPEIATDDVTITGIATSVEDDESGEETTLIYGTDDYALQIENPLILGNENQALTAIGQALKGVTIRPFSGDFSPAPSLEFMDLVMIIDRKDNMYPSFVGDHTFNYLGGSSISNNTEPPERNAASYSSNATQVYKKVQKQLIKQKTAFETSMEQLSQQVANASGLYTTEEEQSDGSTIFYMHNKPTLEESDIVWKMTAETLTVSTDGGKNWNAGLTVNGEVIARIMTSIGINFDWGIGGTLIIEDEDGNQTAYMDADTGAIRFKVESLEITGKTVDEIASEHAEEAMSNFVDSVYTSDINALQAQIDGQIMTWFYDYIPTATNYPASEWITETEKEQHLGDLFYIVDNSESGGQAYRWAKISNVYTWDYVEDTDVTKALAQAQNAQDTADSKRRVFISTPIPPYDAGDLWMQGADGDILTCVKSRQSGVYVSSDWEKKNKYTDNSFAEQVQEDLNNMKFGGRNFLLETAEAKTTTYAGTDNDAGSSLISYLFSDYALERLNEDKTVTISFDWEATGTLDGRFHVQTAYNHYTMLTPAYIYISNDNSSGHYTATVTINTAIDFDRIRVIGYQSHATLSIKNLKIESGNKATDWTPAPEDTATYVDNLVGDLREQVDGKIQTYNQSSDPSAAWTTAALKEQHTGDLWYNTTEKVTARWDGEAWEILRDQEAIQAGELAQSKAQIFTGTPTIPYYKGDLWITALNKTGVVKTCKTTRTTGSYTASDWVEGLKYTDDSFAEQVQEELRNLKIGGRNFLLGTSESKTTTYAGADNDAGSSLISYLFSDYALERLNEDKTVTISFDWEATGTLDGRFHVQTAYNHYIMLTPAYIYISNDNSSGHYTATVTINTAIDFDRIRVIGYQSHATLSIKNLKIESGNKVTEWTPAPEDTDTYIDDLVADLQDQVDGKIQTWYQTSDPSTAWKTNELKTEHTGDIWFNTSPGVQKTYRWNGSAWKETKSNPPDEVFDTIDGKAQVFITTPTPPYAEGDLWFNSTTADIMTCVKTRASGNYTASDWQKRNKYTDDTAVEQLDQALNSTQEIFNRLTQNGTVKGIYLRDNQLYVNATYIESGAIVIRDENNKIIFKADLDNRQIQIDGDFITIGGSALTDMVNEANSTANDALEQVQNARSFVVYLTNEYQGISTDNNGNYTSFPETKTTAQAFLGSLDVSASCQYSVTKSSGVTGSWSSTTRTYTVTGLSTDSGWVEIKATYLNSLSATKRFTLSKIKQGDPGEFALNLIEGTSEEWTATEITDGANKATPMRSAKNVINDGFAVGKKIQYSVDLKFSQDFAATGTGTKNSYIQFYKNYGTTEWLSMDSNAKSQIEAIIASSSKEGRVNGYITITSDMVPTKASDSIGLRIRFDYYEGTVYTRKEMVAFGDKSFSWTPAKEDLKGEPGTDGSDGADGRTYFIQPSRTTLRQTASYNISPGYIDFNSYYRDGTDAARKAYAGRFKIEEQSSSGTWTTIYTSAANESSVRHILYNVLADADGNFIGDADGYAFGGWRDISVIRVSLYAAGGTTQLIDQQTIPVVKDGEKGEDGTALTSEEVFNILTDNGAKQGLYMVDDKIYFNAEYIKSGTMVADLIKGGILNLGGVSNENGVLVMKNASGQEIGRWDKDGIVIDAGSIKANAIKGGTLTLGGASNGNGLLYIRDADGNDIGHISNTGVYFDKGQISGDTIIGGTLRVGEAGGKSGVLSVIGRGGTEIGRWDYMGFRTNGDYFSVDASGKVYTGALINSSKLFMAPTPTDSIDVDDIKSRYSSAIQMWAYAGNGESGNSLQVGRNASGTPRKLYSVDIGENTLHQILMYAEEVVVNTDLRVAGEKNRIVNTDEYGKRLLNCYEMPSPMFGDIGEAITDEIGKCYVFLDDIFQETIATDIEYQVFLQKEGQGDIWVKEKTEQYFVVEGTPNMKFAWEIKARQKNCQYKRLDGFDIKPKITEPDYEDLAHTEYKKIIESYEDSTFDAINYYAELEGVA